MASKLKHSDSEDKKAQREVFYKKFDNLIRSISAKRQAKCVIRQELYDKAVASLKSPKGKKFEDTRLKSWAKYKFFLMTTRGKELLYCSKTKLPVVAYENLFDTLYDAHARVGHHGRDKTRNEVGRWRIQGREDQCPLVTVWSLTLNLIPFLINIICFADSGKLFLCTVQISGFIGENLSALCHENCRKTLTNTRVHRHGHWLPHSRPSWINRFLFQTRRKIPLDPPFKRHLLQIHVAFSFISQWHSSCRQKTKAGLFDVRLSQNFAEWNGQRIYFFCDWRSQNWLHRRESHQW